MSSWLPSEVLLQVIAWIPDASSLYSFLQALGTSVARGPLESLWQLGATTSRLNDLWPSLVLTDAIFQDRERLALVASALDCVSHIHVMGPITRHWVCDVGWLHQHVGPRTTITWHAAFPSSSADAMVHGVVVALKDWFTLWAQLPITHVIVKNPNDTCDDDEVPFLREDVTPYLYVVLKDVKQLVSLHLNGRGCYADLTGSSCTCLVDMLEAVVPLPTLKDLHMQSLWCGQSTALSTTQVHQAITSLWSTKLRRLDVPNVSVDPAVTPAVRNAFFTALFSTIYEVHGYLWDLSTLNDATYFDLTLRKLSLDLAALTPSGLRCLARAVRQSTTLDTLCITNVYAMDDDKNDDDVTPAFEALFDAVGHANVKMLDVSGCGLGPSLWPTLGPLLQQTKLTCISLANNDMQDDGANWLGQAVQANSGIAKIELGFNNITLDGVLALVKSTPDGCNRYIWNGQSAKHEMARILALNMGQPTNETGCAFHDSDY
ncbi:Aste57867_22647 [Aphanomyces stellatus]|uniref:Aste57867_22647 protein n=1 Tax=Aphanomyces stellatus TaxID=120398 RepID=A0A485LLE3_9STRA|nr:hypothetical protein As57867_022577 [Aphanomyces stellatus]VFT99301.1 Aste57867_22647 [Aphanomyces stellatus]